MKLLRVPYLAWHLTLIVMDLGYVEQWRSIDVIHEKMATSLAIIDGNKPEMIVFNEQSM